VKCLRVLSASQFLIYSLMGKLFFVGALDARPVWEEIEMLKKEMWCA